MTSSSKAAFVPTLAGTLLVLLLGLGCAEESGQKDSASWPLRPLIYTEFPDLTPQGAAVREDRLMRQLLEGVSDGTWGRLETESSRIEPLPLTDEPDELGRALVTALLERDDELFEHTFVAPRAYARLVHVGNSEAAEFVDNQIGNSMPLWSLFGQTHSSQMPEGGLAAILEYDGIELGRGRTVGGGVASNEDDAVQFWGNRIFLRHRHTDVRFELRIPRIFRVLEVVDEEDAEEEAGRERPVEPVHVYQIASEIEEDGSFRTFLETGLHLKPQLMRSREYPFPLRVGNFWRYRRFDAAQGSEAADPLARGFDEPGKGLAAYEVVLEVRQVSQYGTVRLVQLQRSYDDYRYTRVQEWWILTPTRVYLCTQDCRDNIENLSWLLGYFERQTPILKFPMRLGEGWAASGRAGTTFNVDEAWHQIESPAGLFPATYAVAGRGLLGTWDPFYRSAEITRYFTPGRGLVRLELKSPESEGELIDVVEELVEYRLTHE